MGGEGNMVYQLIGSEDCLGSFDAQAGGRFNWLV